jgi:adenine/guanine phosphoribosyltransferase-like PRPP-binding protein
LFRSIFKLRMRGAEIVVPRKMEQKIYELLSSETRLVEKCEAKGILLPGSPGAPEYDITDIPKINLKRDPSHHLQSNGIISAFWIKPRQASWLHNGPTWLTQISDAFGKFKSGDMSNVEMFADAMEDQVSSQLKEASDHIGLITSVPLNAAKRKAGEEDRVAKLAQALASRLDVEYAPIFMLKGDISRRRYKNIGYDNQRFVRDYRNALHIRKDMLKKMASSGQSLLLVDDVFTDGVTTQTIIDLCKEAQGCETLVIRVTTLGMMTKKRNLSNGTLRRFEGV